MDWQKLDIWPRGKAGFDARYRYTDLDLYLWIEGTNHPLDWFHHVLPFAKAREFDAGRRLYKRILPYIGARRVHIGGHSLGGAIAIVVANLLTEAPVLTLYAPKRAPERAKTPYRAYRRRGDLVPFLPPNRRPWEDVTVFGSWRPFWLAHEPSEYRRFMDRDGFGR